MLEFDLQGTDGMDRDLVADDVINLILWDDPDSDDLWVLILEGVGDAGDDDVALRFTNVTDLGPTSYGVEWDGTMSDGVVDDGDTLPERDEGAIDIAPGTFLVALRAEGDGPGDGILATTNWGTVATDDLASLFVADWEGDDAGQFATLLTSAVPDIDGLEDDEVLVRFVHVAAGVGEVWPEYKGEPIQVCTPLNIPELGRCSWPCEPYLEGEFEDDGESNDRWEDNGCPHDDDIIYACLGYLTTGNNDELIESDGHPDLGGFCTPRDAATADGDFGGNCTDDGDSVCNPDSFCVGVTDSSSECTKLCLPFSGDLDADCPADQVCLNIIVQQYGLCVEPRLELTEGDTCAQADAGAQCSDDDTFCIGLGTDYACLRICKKGLGDADGNNNPTCPLLEEGGEPRVCRADISFNSTSIPSWVSICDFAP
jgi:hypothetical protein